MRPVPSTRNTGSNRPWHMQQQQQPMRQPMMKGQGHMGGSRVTPSMRGGLSKVRPTSVFQYEDEPALGQAVGMAPFIGGSVRKRKYELAKERGLIVEPPEPAWNKRSRRGGKGGGKKSAQPPPPPGAPGLVTGEIHAVKWISVAADGMFPDDWPELAPVVFQDPDISSLLSNSTWTMHDLDIEKECIEFVHDSDFTEFPAIAEAVKEAGGNEESLCIAKYPPMCIWAVGAAGKWQKREQAAKLALCLAVAGNLPDFNDLAQKQPEFTAFCEGVGIDTDGAAAKVNQARTEKVKAAGGGGEEAMTNEDAEAMKALSDRPIWVDLQCAEDAVPQELMGLPTRGLAIRTEGNARKSLYNRAGQALEALLGVEGMEDVVYHDDPSWEMFPGIGAILKEIFQAEECITVAVSASLQCWAVGIGNRSKNRHAAAKAALATLVRCNHDDLEVDMEAFPVLAEVIEEARAADEPQEFV